MIKIRNQWKLIGTGVIPFNLSKLLKALLLALAAAVVSKKLKPKAKIRMEEMARPDYSMPDVLKPLEHLTRAYWILHPQTALYLRLFQNSFGFAWSLAKRYFGK